MTRLRLSMIGAGVALAASVVLAPPAQAQEPFGDGTYAVGERLAPGLYRTLGGPGCYWARSSDASGAVTSILANRFMAGGRAVVEVEATDAVLSTQGCGTWWPVVDGDMVPMTTFEQGDLLVGRDVEPGTYASEGGESCYWSRSSDASGSITSIVANHFGAGPVVVDVAAEDVVFRSEGCGTWVRQ